MVGGFSRTHHVYSKKIAALFVPVPLYSRKLEVSVNNSNLPQGKQTVTVILTVSDLNQIDYLRDAAMMSREDYVADAVHAALKRASEPSPFREDYSDWDSNDYYANAEMWG